MVTILPGSPKASPEFWQEFDATSPVHLKLGFGIALLVLGHVSPLIFGHFGGLASMSEDAREHFIVRVASAPVLRDLVEIAKVVACLRAFSNTDLEDRLRGRA